MGGHKQWEYAQLPKSSKDASMGHRVKERIMIDLNFVKRHLRKKGMKEEYTEGGANILYCGYMAFRLINEYSFEVWPHYERSSGNILVFESPEDMLVDLLITGTKGFILDYQGSLR